MICNDMIHNSPVWTLGYVKQKIYGKVQEHLYVRNIGYSTAEVHSYSFGIP